MLGIVKDRCIPLEMENLGVSATSIAEEYETVAGKFGFTAAELASLVINDVEAAFLEEDEKEKLRQEFRGRMNELGVMP